jgi:hypothetical protein
LVPALAMSYGPSLLAMIVSVPFRAYTPWNVIRQTLGGIRSHAKCIPATISVVWVGSIALQRIH